MGQRSDQTDLIILTGGAGFIGSCFLWKLNQMGEKNILVVDHSEPDKDLNLKGKTFVDYVDKDKFIAEIEAGRKPKGVKAIWHIGACSSTTELDQKYLDRNNTEYSKTLAKWALELGVPFYYASSGATYGAGELGYSDDDTITPKLQPLNLYGWSKQKFDLWVLENKLQSKIVGFKYFNVFGPNEYHKGEMMSLVVKAYRQIKQDGRIRLFKSYKPEYRDGEQKRDFVYIKDVIELMWQFALRPEVKGIYNIGTGRARTWNDLAGSIFKALKLPVKIDYVEMPTAIRNRYQYFTEADLSKLNRTNLPVNFSSLEDSVGDYVLNYLERGLACL